MKKMMATIFCLIFISSGCSHWHREGIIDYKEGEQTATACTDAIQPKIGNNYSVFRNQCQYVPTTLKRGRYPKRDCKKVLLGMVTITEIIDRHYAKIKSTDGTINFNDRYVLTLE